MNVIVILNYNDYFTVIDYVERIKNYKSIDKIIIVDNSSTDDSVKVLSSLVNDNISLVTVKKNGGYAAGNNVGIKYALEKFDDIDAIIISNPDIIISDSDVLKITGALKTGYQLATGVIHNYKNGCST